MTLAVYRDFVVDLRGNAQNGALVEIRNEATGNLATLYSDRAGTLPIANPVTTDANGFFQAFLAGGAYKVTTATPDGSRTLRYVAIGMAQETDATGAPTDANYLVKTANGSLSAERVVTDNSTAGRRGLGLVRRWAGQSEALRQRCGQKNLLDGRQYMGGNGFFVFYSNFA